MRKFGASAVTAHTGSLEMGNAGVGGLRAVVRGGHVVCTGVMFMDVEHVGHAACRGERDGFFTWRSVRGFTMINSYNRAHEA